MKKPFLPSLGGLFGPVLLLIALWILHQELRGTRYHEILGAVRSLPPPCLALAVLLTIANYLILTGYDALALRYIHHPLAYRNIAFASFISYAFSNNLSLLAGGAARFRFYTAWGLSAVEISKVVAFCIVTFCLTGLNYKEAIILMVMLMALLPCRSRFYRKTSLLRQRFSPGWVVAVLLTVVGFIWLGMFSYRHVEYSHDLWWRFALTEDAPRFLRATVGVIAGISCFALARLLRPAQPEPELPGPAELARARAIVTQCRTTSANLALLGDKALLFNEKGKAFIMYGIEGRSWVAMRDPVGPAQERADLVWQFRELCDRHGGWTVFYEVGPDSLPLYLDLGLSLVKLGEEARVSLDAFSLEGGARKEFRRICHRLEKEGCTFTVIPTTETPSLLSQLQQVSDAWLVEKHTREKGFSVGSFKPAYIQQFPGAMVRQEGKIVAFTNLWLGAGKEELSPDLMRYLPEAPPNVMEYLFLQLMLWGKHAGYRQFSLGMAPLSGLEDHALAPLWNRLGALVFRHGEHFYNFQGLRRYKEKFDPEWEPRYLASPGDLALPRILIDLAALISGGLEGVMTK